MTKLFAAVLMLSTALTSHAYAQSAQPIWLGNDATGRPTNIGGAGVSHKSQHYGNTEYAGGVSRGSSFAGNPNVDLALGHPPVGTILGPLAGSPKVQVTPQVAKDPQ